MITGLDYFYDGQQVRILEQLVRDFSGFKFRTGIGRDGTYREQVVPCRMALRDRMIAQILANGSENTMNTVPMITVTQTGLEPRLNDLQNQHTVFPVQVVERMIDENGKYIAERGTSVTVERLMPLPYRMQVSVDVWTSSQDQKYQLVEQLLIAAGFTFDLQNSDNPVDWSAKMTVNFEGIDLFSKSVPIGNNDDLEIATIRLTVDMWLNPPSRVTRQTLIHSIHTNINEMDETITTNGPTADAADLMGQTIDHLCVRPEDYSVLIQDGTAKLLTENGQETDADGNPLSWRTLLNRYGMVRPAISRLGISLTSDHEDFGMVGVIQYDTTDPSVLIWQPDPDTFQSNTFSPIDGVVDPRDRSPANGLDQAEGTRYLFLSDLGGPTHGWGNLVAKNGDIVEYRFGNWIVAHDAATYGAEYVLNLRTMSQLRWDATHNDWVLAIDGVYPAGHWRIDF